MRRFIRLLFRRKGAINLTTGLIDLSHRDAPELARQLQSVQSAAENAAEAVYQHMTGSALVANAQKLGLTQAQAEALSSNYFEVPDATSTTVASIGNSSIKAIMERIRMQLRYLTGHTDA